MGKKILITLIIIIIISIGGLYATKKLAPHIAVLFDDCRRHKTAAECSDDGSRCEVIYGDSCPAFVDCPPTLLFKGCKALTDETKALRKERAEEYASKTAICAQFGTKYEQASDICRCDYIPVAHYIDSVRNGGPQTFIENEGCVFAREVCESQGGEWKDDFMPFQVVEARLRFAASKSSYAVPKKSCDGEDRFCSSSSKYEKQEGVRCFRVWNDVLNRCDLEVYKRDEIRTPCKIGDEYFDSNSLFKLLPKNSWGGSAI